MRVRLPTRLFSQITMPVLALGFAVSCQSTGNGVAPDRDAPETGGEASESPAPPAMVRPWAPAPGLTPDVLPVPRGANPHDPLHDIGLYPGDEI